MSDRTVTLTISETAYARAQRIAQDTAQPIEYVLSNRLEEALDDRADLPTNEHAELTAFQFLSDDALWTIAREQISHVQQERLSWLLALNKRGTLTQSETSELDDLLKRSDQLMVRKAESAALLTGRGYTVTPQNMAAPIE